MTKWVLQALWFVCLTFALYGCEQPTSADHLDDGATLTISIPYRLNATVTYDSVRHWGTRCETTFGYSVKGNGRIEWRSGSSWDWYQLTDGGRVGPFTMPWDHHVLNTLQLQAGDSGAFPLVLVGGNDGGHLEGPPYFEVAGSIRYASEGSQETRTATFVVLCAP